MTYPVPRASPAVDSPCLQTQTPSSRQPLREQARVLPRLRRQQHRRPSRGGGHVRRLRRTGAHRGGVRDAGAKHEPHEHVAVRLLRRRSRPRHRVRPSQEEQVHQDVRIGRRRVARASEDVLEAVRSGTAWKVTRSLQRLSARHAVQRHPICRACETLGHWTIQTRVADISNI